MRLLFCIFIFFSAFSSHAQSKDWGLGVILANPTGFSVKHRFDSKHSLDGALGYGWGDYLSVHSTYLWEFNRGLKIDRVALGYYFGVGGALYSIHNHSYNPPWHRDRRYDELGLALRGSAGLNYYFQKPSIEVFAELAMNFFFVPATGIDLGLAIGGRFFF